MSACRAAHDTNLVGIQAVLLSLTAHQLDGTLQVLPCRDVLGHILGAGCTVFHSHDRHTQLVQVTACRSYLEALRAIPLVAAARIDNLYGVGLLLLGEVPFYVGLALMFLCQRHLAFRPYILCNFLLACIIVGETLHDILFGCHGAGYSQLSQELNGAIQSEGTMTFVGIEVQLGRNLTLAQLPIDKGRAVGRVFIQTAVMQAHGAGLLVELKASAQLDVGAIPLLCGRSAQLTVGCHIGRRICNGPVDVAGNGVQLVDRLVGRCLRAGGKQNGQMRAGRHRDGANVLGVEAALLGLAAHQTYGALSVLPRSLIDGQTFWAGCTVNKVYALVAQSRESFAPLLDEAHIAAVIVATARDKDHTAAIGVGRLVEPLQISCLELLGFEAFRICLVCHGSNLMLLCIGHLTLGPYTLALPCHSHQGAEES